jgi:hypothetical protein
VLGAGAIEAAVKRLEGQVSTEEALDPLSMIFTYIKFK